MSTGDKEKAGRYILPAFCGKTEIEEPSHLYSDFSVASITFSAVASITFSAVSSITFSADASIAFSAGG